MLLLLVFHSRPSNGLSKFKRDQKVKETESSIENKTLYFPDVAKSFKAFKILNVF